MVPALKTPRFVVYYRVSTESQGRSGLGLEAQRKIIKDYVGSVGGEIVAPPFTEVETGKKDDRPQLAKAISQAKRHKATLLVAKLDRLARSNAFVSALLATKGVEFRACDMPEANKTMLQMLSVFGEYEADMISQRTKQALAARKARGLPLGNPKNLKRGNPAAVAMLKAQAQAEAERMRPIIEGLKAKGIGSVRGIAAALNDQGYLTERGNPWHPTQVARLLSRLS